MHSATNKAMRFLRYNDRTWEGEIVSAKLGKLAICSEVAVVMLVVIMVIVVIVVLVIAISLLGAFLFRVPYSSPLDDKLCQPSQRLKQAANPLPSIFCQVKK